MRYPHGTRLVESLHRRCDDQVGAQTKEGDAMTCEELRDIMSGLSSAMDSVLSCHDRERKNELPRVQRWLEELSSADCPKASDRDVDHRRILVRQAVRMLDDAIDWQRFQCAHKGRFIGHWYGHDVWVCDSSILAQASDEPSDYASCDMETLNQQLCPSHRCGLEDGKTVSGLEKIFDGHSSPYKRAMLCGMLKLAEVYNKMACTNSVTARMPEGYIYASEQDV